MKKQYNVKVKKTFISTGITQAAFLIAYALWVLIYYCLPDKGVIVDIMILLSVLLILAPVMPICLISNSVVLACHADENKKIINWLYVILSALIMFFAWLFYGVIWVSITGGV